MPERARPARPASRAGSAGSLALEDPVAGWQVEVEVVVLRLLPDGALGHRWVRDLVPVDVTPDERAVQLVGCTGGVCHSTSWRWAGPGTLRLTCAALPDPDLLQPAELLPSPLVVAGGAALAPTPSTVEAAHVAGHAVRHLADLAERDPVVQGQVDRAPTLWAALLVAARQARHERGRAAPRGAR